MITVTDKAAHQLQKTMKEENKQDLGLKIHGGFSLCCGFQCNLSLEEKPKEGDMVIESNGIKIFINEYVYQFLDGAIIDYPESQSGFGFIIKF